MSPKDIRMGKRILGLIIIFVSLCIGMVCDSISSTRHEKAKDEVTVSEISEIEESGYQRVHAALAEQGMRIDRQQGYPHFYSITVPSHIAVNMTQNQAEEVAAMAQSRIGEKARVRVYSESGRRLGSYP